MRRNIWSISLMVKLCIRIYIARESSPLCDEVQMSQAMGNSYVFSSSIEYLLRVLLVMFRVREMPERPHEVQYPQFLVCLLCVLAILLMISAVRSDQHPNLHGMTSPDTAFPTNIRRWYVHQYRRRIPPARKRYTFEWRIHPAARE